MLGRVLAAVLAVVTLGLSLGLAVVRVVEALVLSLVKRVWLTGRVRELLGMLPLAGSYTEHVLVSRELDRLMGKDAWKREPETRLMDVVGLQKRTRELERARVGGDWHRLASLLRKCAIRNVSGMANPALYAHTYVGTKVWVNEYVAEVVRSLGALVEVRPSRAGPSSSMATSLSNWKLASLALSDSEDGDDPAGDGAQVGAEHGARIEGDECGGGHSGGKSVFPRQQDKMNVFWEMRQSYGRSALLLSGGASNGMYHLGVVKGLAEQELLPRVISGSSVGSLVAAMACVRTDEELPELFVAEAFNLDAFDSLGPGGTVRKIKRLFSEGVLMDVNKLANCLRDNIGDDVTFVDAYRRTGRLLNITVSSTQTKNQSRLLNYLSAPNVLIWSAALASCAIPYVYAPVEILERGPKGAVVPWEPSGALWMDGSVYHDLPMMRLAELFNVNFFVVSQVNPHVVPFLSAPRIRSKGLPSRLLAALMDVFTSEVRHRVRQLARVGMLPSFVAQLRPLLEQTYKGDVTFIPSLSLADYASVISNPTTELIRHAIKCGERTVWEKVDRLEVSMRIEHELDALVTRVRNECDRAVRS